MNRIGTTRFGCGCTVHTEPDVSGITPWLEHCPRHAAATDLRVALAALLARIDTMTSEEFARGGDRVERECARAVIERLGIGATAKRRVRDNGPRHPYESGVIDDRHMRGEF